MQHELDNSKQNGHKADGSLRRREELPADPSLHPVMQLQQQAGNQAVQELLHSGAIQARLEVSDPADPAEAEAERVADRVMRAAENQEPCPCTASGGEMCDACNQKQAAVHRQTTGDAEPGVASGVVDEVLRSPGQALDPATRAFFEPRFGHDLSHVRVHTGGEAAGSARAINAQAYTAGKDVVFGPGQYSPHSTSGRRLLAHELTHVLQQRPGVLARQPATPAFKKPGIQRAYDSAAGGLSPGQVSALQMLDKSLAGPWAKLAWTDIAASAADRVVNPSHISQVTLEVCASAAALEAEAATNAQGYADEVCHVFSKGDLGGTKVNKGLLNATPPETMDRCDWMMLSAAQDTSNLVRDFKGQPGEGKYQGGYGPQGTKGFQEEWLLKHLDDCVKTTSISCGFFGEDAASTAVRDLMDKYGDKVVVFARCDAGMLQGKDGAIDGTGERSCHVTPDHVVRLIRLVYGDFVRFRIFTWGQEVELSWDVKRYQKWVYGYVVGAKQADIPLP